MGSTLACRQLSSSSLHFLSLLIICLGGIMFRFGICISSFVKTIPILYPTMIEIMPLERTWLDLGKHEQKRGWTDKAFCQHFAQVFQYNLQQYHHHQNQSPTASESVTISISTTISISKQLIFHQVKRKVTGSRSDCLVKQVRWGCWGGKLMDQYCSIQLIASLEIKHFSEFLFLFFQRKVIQQHAH